MSVITIPVPTLSAYSQAEVKAILVSHKATLAKIEDKLPGNDVLCRVATLRSIDIQSLERQLVA